ncbi:hypothetical protein EWP19_16035 [Acinetobacter piscicola]|nr:hypothetical protein EWP19_16035 [Acinetobacter piscicola]
MDLLCRTSSTPTKRDEVRLSTSYFFNLNSTQYLIRGRWHGCHRWTGGKGIPLSPTKDFCYFSSLKSKELPTQRYMPSNQYLWLCSFFSVTR